MGKLCNTLGLVGFVAAAGLAGCDPVRRPAAKTEEGSLLPDAGATPLTVEMAPLVEEPKAVEGEVSSPESEAPPDDLAVADGEEASRGATAQTGQLAAVGTACTEDAQCETSACVDGFCCDSECDGVCVSCGQAGSEGTCQPTESDEVCPTLNCPQSTECLEYSAADAGNCSGARQCREEAVCTATSRPVDTPCGEGGEGTCDGQGVCVVPDKANLGEGCSVDGDCAEGNCVQGVDSASLCCDSACDGECQVCGANGRCDATPLADARCEAVECPANNVCRVYPQLGAGQCAAFGVCQGREACFAEAQELRPDAQCDCGQDGNCSLTVGTSCQGDSECASGACEATSLGRTICCAQGCGNGLFCAGDGRNCVECEGNSVSCEGNDAVQCAGGRLVSTACDNGCTQGQGCNARAPLGFSCAQSQCEQGTFCQDDNAGGRTCCSRDCDAEGKVCSPDGSCGCPPGQLASGNSCLRQVGERCEAGNQCQGGNCVDGVCCSEACNGFCEQCQLGSGQCVALGAGQTDNAPQTQCNNTHECTGARGDCRARTGESCTQDQGCVSGSCVDTGNGARVCCFANCAQSGSFCGSDGRSCVECVGVGAECRDGLVQRCGSGQLLEERCEFGCAANGFECEEGVEEGEECESTSDCITGVCDVFYEDLDNDGHGNPREEDRFCASSSQFVPPGYSRLDDDCCDSTLEVAASIYPGDRPFDFFADPQSACSNVNPFDYDCSGTLTRETPDDCDDQCNGAVWSGGTPACGESGVSLECFISSDPDRVPRICSVQTFGPPEPIVQRCR